MEKPMANSAIYNLGQLVRHSLFEYRGAIIDVDPKFMLSEEWYELMAKSQPPKDEPWYRVLVHGAQHETYVAERNLEACDLEEPIINPGIDTYFSAFENGKYILNKSHAN